MEDSITSQDKLEDDCRDISIRITDKLEEIGLVPDSTDTDDPMYFEVQDIITEILISSINQLMKNEEKQS